MTDTALLALGVQTGIVNNLSHNADAYLRQLASTINTARDKGVYILYITSSFRPGYSDVHLANNPMAGGIRRR